MNKPETAFRMSDKIQVMHFLWSGHSGGMERFVRDVTRTSNKARFEHSVCFLSEGGWFADDMLKSGTRIAYLGMKTGFSAARSMRIPYVIRKWRPHIIHNHIRNYFLNIYLLNYPTIPKIFFEHGGDFLGKSPHRDISFYKYFARQYDVILANSEYVRQQIVGLKTIDPQKVRTFYIGIDPKPYQQCRSRYKIKQLLSINGHKKVIGVVGRLVEQKGMDDFIRVAHEIQKMRQDVVFLIIGDGKKRMTLERMSLQYDVDILFLGDRLDVPDLLSIFDVFLFTSKWEPFGIVLLEAMAAKVPILGFAVGGAREIIDKGGGVLFEKRDHEKLAQLTVQVLGDQKTYERLSAQGYANMMRNFNIASSIKDLEKEYMALLSKQ